MWFVQNMAAREGPNCAHSQEAPSGSEAGEGAAAPCLRAAPSARSGCARPWRRLQLITPYQTPFRNLQCLICLLPWQRLLLALGISKLPGRAPSFSYQRAAGLAVPRDPRVLPPAPARGQGLGLPWERSTCRAPVPHRDRGWGTRCAPISCSFPFLGWCTNVAKLSVPSQAL